MDMPLRKTTAAASGQRALAAGVEGADSGALSSLTCSDIEARRRAALALSRTGAAERGVPEPAAVAALLARVGNEDDLAVREAVLVSLAERDHPAVALAVAGHLRSDDAALRTAVVDALAAMPAAVGAVLPELVVDPDPDVRNLAIMLLAAIDPDDARPYLLAVLEREESARVVGTALDAARAWLGPEHEGLLAEIGGRFAADPFLRFALDAARKSWVGDSSL